ncbi:MAG TPA: tetratricopeptide repeat protein [Phenylobacterium sp.]|jgi:tetratricopeptide (TPR) repeat protein|nr:tetratricopeptide repeat protein [Phenylobacterium sp.]
MREAVAQHVAGRLVEAQAGYRAVLAERPSHAEALSMLALILTDGPDLNEAEVIVQRLLAVRPEDGASLLCLARLRVRQGDDAAAIELFQRVAARQPNLAPVQNELGVSLNRLGQRDEALTALDRALAIDPAYAVARGNRAMVLFDAGRFDAATEALLAVLANGDPGLAEMRASLIGTLVKAAAKARRLSEAEAAIRAQIAAGNADTDSFEQLARLFDFARRPQEALAIRNELSRRAGVQRKGPARAPRDTIAVVGAVGAGHVPTRYLLDPEVFTTLFVGLLSPEQPDAPLGSIEVSSLAEAGVIFSTLGDAHRDWGQLAEAEAFCARLGKPVVNPPASIRKTGRDAAPALFGDIPGLIAPSATPITPKALAALSIDAPVLVRPPGDHGGENLVKLTTANDRDAYLAADPEVSLLLTPFHDFRSPDGAWRKYRLIFVDRQVFPFHLAIGEDWLLHYWRAEMAKSDWKKAEEERFLDDWRGVFGPTAAAALEETARRLDLDYGGVDCALMPDGQVLLFEANATILLHLDEPAKDFPGKHRHVPKIREAFTRLIHARADGRQG